MASHEFKIKSFNSKNFNTWKFRVTTAVEKLSLKKYLNENVIANIKSKKDTTTTEETTNNNNATVREIIINSLDDNILKDYLNVSSAHVIMDRLARKYGGNNSDLKHWIKKLNSLRAKSESEISTTLENIIDIF